MISEALVTAVAVCGCAAFIIEAVALLIFIIQMLRY
jgi:hypothetical protein